MTPPTTIVARLARALLPFAAAALAGCSVGHRVDTAELLGHERPAAEPLTAAEAYPVPSRKMTSTWSDRAGAGDFQRVTAPAGDPGSWLVTDSRDGKPITENLYAKNPKGDVVLVRSTDHGERVISWFSPGLIVMPDRLEPNQTHRQTTTIRIYPIDDPDHVRDQGPVTQEMTLESDQIVQTPLGPIPSRRVHVLFTADLGVAKVEKTSDLWFTTRKQDPGLVANRSDEIAKALGLTVRNVRQFLVLEAP